MIRFIAFLWMLTHMVITGCAAVYVVTFTPSWSGDQAGLFLAMVALYWVSIVWATALVAEKKRK